MNIEQARFNMIEQQIRPWDILDQQVLELIKTTPREKFVPQTYEKLAFTDMQIPLAHHQFMMEPKVEAKILQSLKIQPAEVILEVGTGSGYLTACLAKLGSFVHSVDIFPEFKYSAQEALQALDITNISIRTGDASQAWDAALRYDVIVLTGATYQIPKTYKQALTINGRLFVIIGEAPAMQAYLITRVDHNAWREEILFETCIPSLIHAEKPQQFIF